MDYDGFNDVKRKKMKALPMSSSELESHAQALFSLLMKPVVNSSAQWKNFGIEIQSLAECYLAYSRYLNKQNMNMQSRQALPYPARTVDKDATLEHRQKCAFGIKPAYQLLENAVKLAGKSVPVMFDEFIHTENPFSSNDQRFRFFKNLQLSMPVDVIKYSPGGSCFSTVCLVHVPEARSEAEILTQGARFLQQIKPKLKEFHTRAQRRLFKEKLKNVASVLPSVADMIYKELTLDASVAAHPVTEERMRLIFLGNTGLIRDLRSLNPGRPSGTFDTFFDALAEIVENVTIADDRRHGLAHFSDFISLEEMIKKAQDSCPEGTNIPSKTLVRLQFAPKNPYTKRALNFTSRINVQYKIQRRQLRVSHPDDHFCNAQFKYMKERAIVQRDQCLLLFCDDKAKVPFGDPDHAISTGVRGKQSIVPTSSTLVALDHDMTRSSLTPSVFLLCDIPETINASFVRGQVTTIVNDATFQTSSPFRHGAAMAKMIGGRESIPPILMKYTDGGTDQRNTLESVKCATICLFRELNLDMIILARCAPGHSYTNPAERVMSILNLGLQNVCLQRKSCEAEVETQLKRCGSMAELREAEKKNPDRKLKEKWLEAVEPTQSFIRNRFLRLCLKDKPFAAMDPVSELEIDNFKRHLRELFPGLDLEKLTKANTGKNDIYNAWIANHCRSRNYTFQIKKCNDVACCIAPKLSPEELHWLPDPVLDLTGNHFKPYSEVKNTDTDDSDRPSVTLKVKAKGIKEQNQQKKKKKEKTNTEKGGESAVLEDDSEDDSVDIPEPDAHLCIAQNARAVVSCVECRKPRLVYSHHRLTDRQMMTIVLATSEYDYTCGGPLLPPSNAMYKNVMCRTKISCNNPVEVQYYASGLGRLDICSFCTSEHCLVNSDLKKKFKTVLPACRVCIENGMTIIVARPYGKT